MQRPLFVLLMSLGFAANAFVPGTGHELVFSCATSKHDICGQAIRMEAHLNERLPIKRNEMVTIEKAKAKRNEITLVLRLDEANGNEFRDAINAYPEDGETMKTMVVEQISQESCKDQNIASFIGEGGVLTYRFIFADGEVLSTINVSRCD